MKIKCGKYYLNSDQYSMRISKEFKAAETGKVRIERITGYRLNLDDLLGDFMHKHTMGSDAETLKELIEVTKQYLVDAEALKKTALEHDFRIMRKLSKKL